MAKRKAGKPKPQPKEQPALESRQRLVETVPYVLVIIGLPLFFAMLLHVGGAPGQLYLSVVLLAASFSSWLLRRLETQAFPFQPAYLASLFLFGCVLMISLELWNYLFRLYVLQVNFTGDIFRPKFRNYYAPLYGYLQFPSFKGYLLSIIPVGLFAVYLLKYRIRVIEEYSNPASIFFFLLFSVSLALTDDISRLTDWIGHYGYFAQGLPFFTDISDLIRNYTLKMDQLGIHNNHYPPGILLTLKIEELLHFKGMTRLLVILAGIGSLWVVKKTAKMLGGSDRCAQLAGFLFILSPGILVFVTADPGYMVLFPASLTLFLFLKGLISGAPVYAVGMGLIFSIYTLFSFSSGFLALLLGMVFLLLWRNNQVRFSTGLTQISLGVVAFTLFYIILHHATGFDLLVCLKEAIQNNARQMSNAFDDGIRYLFRSTGAIQVYLVTAGIPLSYLVVRRAIMATRERDCSNLVNVMSLAVMLSLLICGFSGFFFLETERIWLFFTPAVAIAAAGEAEKIYVDRGAAPIFAILFSSLLLSIVYELCLLAFSWR